MIDLAQSSIPIITSCLCPGFPHLPGAFYFLCLEQLVNLRQPPWFFIVFLAEFAADFIHFRF
jgi:hypothetical protein